MHPQQPPAHDVILAALAINNVPSVDTHARLIEAALIEHGHLPPHEQEMTRADVEKVAQWLAERSMHPRYVMVADGWHRLMESASDVHLAHSAATKTAPQGTGTELDEARRVLLGWQNQHGVDSPGDRT